MANLTIIPDGSIDWGAAMRSNLAALNTEVGIANAKANSAINLATARVRSVNSVFPDENGNVVVVSTAVDQAARDAAAAAQSTADSKYLLPAGGIPATTLASAVQTSLTQANSAVQPAALSAYIKTVNNTVPDANGNVTVTVEGGGYIKPSGGIPSSDMTTAVQTSLGKADSALQSAPVTSVAGKTGAVTLVAADITNGTSTWVPVARAVSPGTGLTGGGDLTANRTLSLTTAVQTSLSKADTAVQPGDAKVTVGAWTAWNPDSTAYTSTLQYRLTPDAIQWRGSLTRTAGPWATNSTITIGTVPTEARVLDFTRLAWHTYGTVFFGLQLSTNGTMSFITGAAMGADIYLNGLNYAR